MDNSENLIKLMDAVVIKLEGGTDEDLKVLDSTERNRYFDEEESHRIPDTVAQVNDLVFLFHCSHFSLFQYLPNPSVFLG